MTRPIAFRQEQVQSNKAVDLLTSTIFSTSSAATRPPRRVPFGGKRRLFVVYLSLIPIPISRTLVCPFSSGLDASHSLSSQPTLRCQLTFCPSMLQSCVPDSQTPSSHSTNVYVRLPITIPTVNKFPVLTVPTSHYPTLCKVAYDVLRTCEHIFSSAKLTTSVQQNKLSLEIIETRPTLQRITG